ncbi:MAG TPA: trypsin-like peptidase domain-containing protein [Gaiellaceae bacterium]|nr:trypsin-like peptidase domain-containing protein [Gaiellaceae bacterium]
MNLRPASPRLRRLIPIAVAAAIGIGVGAGAYALSSDTGSKASATPKVVVPAQPASSTSPVDSLTQLYKQDAPGVVDITVMSTSSTSSSGGFPFGTPNGTQRSEAEGTGFVIDPKGDILTAEHVVDNATKVTVTFEDGSTANATVVGTDKSTDTAVIRVNVPSSKLHPLALGNSSSVQPGQSVVAIGSPFGLPETMTGGIVSATNRTITAPNQFSITGAIQTDAAINHGNSGGPLIDVATNTVIGINDQIESDTNDNAGIGFAVPINSSKAVAQTLIAGGKVRHAYVGIRIKDVTDGAQITQVVKNSPAASAGLKVGDVITSFDGNTITSADTLTAAVFNAKSGQTVPVTVKRNGATQHLSVKLGVQPASPSS